MPSSKGRAVAVCRDRRLQQRMSAQVLKADAESRVHPVTVDPRQEPDLCTDAAEQTRAGEMKRAPGGGFALQVYPSQHGDQRQAELTDRRRTLITPPAPCRGRLRRKGLRADQAVHTGGRLPWNLHWLPGMAWGGRR